MVRHKRRHLYVDCTRRSHLHRLAMHHSRSLLSHSSNQTKKLHQEHTKAPEVKHDKWPGDETLPGRRCRHKEDDDDDAIVVAKSKRDHHNRSVD